ncbi:immunoglobulin I-set domain protein [Ancylostoma duodenale]|uniref:Immunoglobulin I-set domain protein n=1 Tax=Ancylostoma duodenale TaxID=51022 RepID=A0A0C2DHK8_9BILA|nr:immunoglobulin I-set domain protein [Ancylostoma duodenale]
MTAIRQSEPVHPHTATQTAGVMKENVAQINLPTAQPDKRQFTKSAVPIDRIDDIVVPERVPHTTAEVSQTVTDEGFIRHVDQDFTPTQVTTTERTVHGGVAVERGGKVVKEEEVVTTVSERTDEEDAERKRQLEQLEKMEREVEERLRRGPEVEKRVTQTTSAEGWVQHVEDDMAKPQAVQTTKRYEKEVVEDSLSKRQTTTGGGETTVSTTKKEEEEEERKKMTQSRIPQRTTKVTTTTTADGFVQHVHDEMAQPVEVTSTTTRTEGEDAQWKRTVQTRRAEPVTEKTTSTTTTSYVQMSASRPFEPTTQTQQTTEQREERVVEDESRYRDSFIAASEGEGFWTDGAYTTSPSPPPIPRHRVLEEELREKKITDIGLSRTSSEPQFIRGFHREYTVDEGGSISIECVLVGNPRPKVRFFINDKEIRKESKFVEIVTSGDTYSIVIEKARLEHAGYYKIVAENTRGKTESLTMLHVRPQSLIQHHKRNGHAIPSQKITEYRTPTEHTTVTEEFAMFEYEQRRPQKHETSRLVTPPPAKRFQAHRKDEEMLEHYDLEQRQTAGHPPHFTQTLVAAVAADGETAKFEGIVTGWPAPTVEWTKDGEPFTRTTLPDVDISNIGGRVSLSFKIQIFVLRSKTDLGLAYEDKTLTCISTIFRKLLRRTNRSCYASDQGPGERNCGSYNCRTIHGGKYMCTARNASGVATSSAQLVIRPKTVAPDFIQRLISEEMVEGDQLKWTVRVTGDPLPRVTWLRDGIEIPDCEEVRIIDEGDGVHSLLIVRVEIADSGQFTCLAENVAGEARSTADLVVRQPGSRPGSYFHITKVQGEHPVRNSAFTIENPPLQSAML